MVENKAEILDMLCKTLRKTRRFNDLVKIEYCLDHGDEYAVVVFERGEKRINITADSGIAAIYDVVTNL